jgi:predicted nucleic acid-binding protein
LVFVATVTLLKVGYGARSDAHYRQVFDSGLIQNLIECPGSGESDTPARNIQEKLVTTSKHTGVSVPDLLISAFGATAGHTVLHHDKHFDIISQVTGQPSEWLRV